MISSRINGAVRVIDSDDLDPIKGLDVRSGAQRPARNSPVFGRQNRAGTTRSGHTPSHSRGATRSQPEPLVVRYTWKVGLLGAGLLVLAVKLAVFGMTLDVSPGGGVQMLGTGQPSSNANLFLTSAALLAFIGLGWLTRALSPAPALKIDATGVSGFTLLGSKHIAWADIERVSLGWSNSYRRNIIVHTSMFSASGGLVTGIQLPLGRVDTPLDQIISAMRAYRPDIPIKGTAEPNALLRLMLWYTKLWGRALGD